VSEARATNVPLPARPQARLHAGLRLQIVVALAGLMLLAFGPLYFAVASLTRATVIAARDQTAAALGEAIAAHVFDALRDGDRDAVARAVRAQSENPDVVAVCAFAADGPRVACEGATSVVGSMAAPPPGPARVRSARAPDGRSLREFSASFEAGSIVVRLRPDPQPGGGQALLPLVALYMGVFALAIIVFAAFALTRLIVRPVEGLGAAADRVASGARNVRFPRAGARELVDLGASVQAMTEKLVAEEGALRSKVNELTETTTRLTAAQSQLVRSERMASVGQLVAGLAHEIGNPLAALMGMQDILLDGLDGTVGPEAQRDFLQRMRRETERIHTVVRDLLDFARPERGATEATRAPTPEPADVQIVVDDVVSLVRLQRPFRAVRLETQMTGALHVALAAPRLTQVLLNLVLNACAAVASSERDGRVVVRARFEGDGRVRIEVEDDGPGIAPAIRKRLFEPFATTKDVGEGTGLGLAVCRGLVEGAGGEIGFDPSYVGGARFYVVLKAAEEPQGAG
jgi:two-component system NtrC family sensor kinase